MINHRLTQITQDIYWVGVVDWNLRDFHGFEVSRGGTYNAFFVDGEEPLVVDTVKAGFGPEFLGKVAELSDLKKVKHLIVNHIEPDHSGAFPDALKAMPNATIYATENAISGLHRYYQFDRPIELVHHEETRVLGGRPYQFIETPMGHWPDSMVTWMPNEKVLFSSDIFGQLFASSERFDFELDRPPYEESALYYANIIMPFNHLVLKIVKLFNQRDIKPDLILPDHGVIWQDHVQGILDHYQYWASGGCAQGALIIYDSMWGSTEMMANHLYNVIADSDIKVQKLHIRSCPMSRLVTEIMLAKVILIGTPTINDTIFPPVGQLLSYLQGLRPGKHRLWGAFGSYGWGGGGVETLVDWYRENQHEILGDSPEARFRPTEDKYADCAAMAKLVIEQVRAARSEHAFQYTT